MREYRKQSMTETEAFWSKIDISPYWDACWLWQPKSRIGKYGKFWRINLKTHHLSHRVAYEITYGSIPDELTVDHACNTTLCCNPEHLYLATRGDNTRRFTQAITHCPEGHEYSEENTRYERSGKWTVRRCVICKNTNQNRRYREKHSAE